MVGVLLLPITWRVNSPGAAAIANGLERDSESLERDSESLERDSESQLEGNETNRRGHFARPVVR